MRSDIGPTGGRDAAGPDCVLVVKEEEGVERESSLLQEMGARGAEWNDHLVRRNSGGEEVADG